MWCCVNGCKKEKYAGCGIPFYSLPKDEAMAEKWRKVIPGKVTESSVICGSHFKDDDFTNNYFIKKLKSNAVPSIFPRVLKRPRVSKTATPIKTEVDGDFDPELLLETFVTRPNKHPKLLKEPPPKGSQARHETRQVPQVEVKLPTLVPKPIKHEGAQSGMPGVCQVCLHADFKSENDVDDALIEFYYELVHHDFQLSYCPRLQFCAICEHMLRKLYNFRQKCRRAHILLKAWSTQAEKTSLDSLHTMLPETSIGFWTGSSVNNVYSFVSSDTKEVTKVEEEAYSGNEDKKNIIDKVVVEYVANEYSPETAFQAQSTDAINKGKAKIKKIQCSPVKKLDKYDRYINMLKKSGKLRNTQDKMNVKEYIDDENKGNEDNTVKEDVHNQKAYIKYRGNKMDNTDKKDVQNQRAYIRYRVNKMDNADNTEEYVQDDSYIPKTNDENITDVEEYDQNEHTYLAETIYGENDADNTEMEEYVEDQNTYLDETKDMDNTEVEEYVEDQTTYLHDTNDTDNTVIEEYVEDQDTYLHESNDGDDTVIEECVDDQSTYIDESNDVDNKETEEYIEEYIEDHAYLPTSSYQKVNLPGKDKTKVKKMDKYDKYIDMLKKGNKPGITKNILQYDTDDLGKSKRKYEKFTKHVVDVILERIENGEFADIVDRGTVITKELFLNMLEKTKMKCMSVEPSKIRWFLSTLLQRYNPIYESMFVIEQMETKEQMLADFDRQKASKQYREAEHKCEICCRIFGTTGKKAFHMQWHDPEKPICCEVCEMRFETTASLQSHIHYNHKLTISCKKCDYVTNSNKSMKSHYDSHLPNSAKQFRCPHCNKVFRNMNWLRNHISQKHRPRKYWCTICGGNFVRTWGLQQHIIVKHHDVSPEELNSTPTHQCEHCDAAFHRQVALENHIQLQHVKYDDVSIASCCEEYTDPEQLRAHKLLSHKSNIRRSPKTMPVRYKTCRVCKEVHHSRRMYTHHVQNHPDVPYTVEGITKLCDLCGKGYKSQLEYNDHMNIHYGVKPYECSVCGASFTSRVGASTHLQRHGPRTYRCEHCGKSFYTSTARAAHLRIHIGDRRYRCETCDKGFLHAASLRHHVDGVHNKIRRVKKKPTFKRERTSQNEISQDDSSQSQDDYVIVKVDRDDYENRSRGRRRSVKKKEKENLEELDEQDYEQEEQNEDHDDYDDQDYEGDEIVDEDHDEFDQTDDNELVKNDPKVETQIIYYSDEGETQGFDGVVNQDGEDLIYFVQEHANEEIVESVNIE